MTDAPKTIDTLTAWIVTEPSGDEAVPAFKSDNGWLPMMGVDPARIESLRPMAMLIAKANGLPLRLVRFSTREVLEEHPPE